MSLILFYCKRFSFPMSLIIYFKLTLVIVHLLQKELRGKGVMEDGWVKWWKRILWCGADTGHPFLSYCYSALQHFNRIDLSLICVCVCAFVGEMERTENENEVTARQGSSNIQHQYCDNKDASMREQTWGEAKWLRQHSEDFTIHLSLEGVYMRWLAGSDELVCVAKASLHKIRCEDR